MFLKLLTLNQIKKKKQKRNNNEIKASCACTECVRCIMIYLSFKFRPGAVITKRFAKYGLSIIFDLTMESTSWAV